MILDLFAGPGGWSEGLRHLGLTDVGVEFDAAACATRAAAGHETIQADITSLSPEPWAGLVDLLIASPPCQAFSLAGKQRGLADPRGQLVYEVIRWAQGVRPRFIACEQVPPVLRIWEQFAETLGFLGYSTWTGNLQAEQFGVPQTRKRAFLLASLDGPVQAPQPTHRRYRKGTPQSEGDPTLLPWVSMADALPRLRQTQAVSNYGTGRDSQNRGVRDGGEPFATITSKVDRVVLRHNAGERDRPRDPDTGKQIIRDETGDYYQRFPANRPAPSISTQANAWAWELHNRRDSVRRLAEDGPRPNRATAEPAPTLTGEAHRWPWERPSTTIVGSFCPDTVAGPAIPRAGDGPRPNAPGSVKITIEEALVLQSFRPDYAVQGSKTKQFQQVGNAIPPLLAARVIESLLGLQRAEAVA